MTITAAQSRAARGLLDWRQHELADAAGVGLSTVRDLETSRREVSPEKLAAIRRALEDAGVEFLAAAGERIGARFRAGIAEPDPRDKRDAHGNVRSPRPRQRPGGGKRQLRAARKRA